MSEWPAHWLRFATINTTMNPEVIPYLLDFARLVDRFDQRGVSFVSVTQQFNTTTSLGRLTLNILLSFAQFEREIIGERTSDKMSAARRKGSPSRSG